MPVADGDSEVILETLARHNSVRVIDLECKRIVGIRALEFDGLGNIGEELGHVVDTFRWLGFLAL